MIALWLAVSAASLADPAKEPAPKKTPFDSVAAKKSFEENQRELAAIRSDLKFAALDQKLSTAERVKAIKILARFDDAQTIRFLVTQRALTLQPEGDPKAKPLQPCLNALVASYDGNWQAGKHLLQCIDLMKVAEDYGTMARLLNKTLGANLAVALVENELATKPKLDRQMELEKLRDHLSNLKPRP